MIAVICGTPIPATTRVVQIEPGPMPTLIASAPALMRSSVARAVATLPAMTGTFGYLALICLRQLKIMTLCPCAESSTRTSALALTSSSTRSIKSRVMPIAAPASRRPLTSRAECGYRTAFSISLMVIRPRRRNSSSTIGSFSILCFRRISCAPLRSVPTGAVTRFSLVMTSLIGML